jgi:Txe/YoeB family toxin of Txe-Axe toxin-antitoxin module
MKTNYQLKCNNNITDLVHVKSDFMSYLKKKQLQYEINNLKRLLDFITDENVHLKNRIAEILSDRFDTYLLEEVDNFQSSLVKEDALIVLLRNEITEVDSLLAKETNKDTDLKKKIETRLKRLQRNMHTAEKQFGKLKLQFHRFLSKNIV